jgi:hypothetical protein
MSSARGMPRLFSYVLRHDDGAAPNPFWGVCTLAICKPAIRRTAKEGDWVVGTGSKRAPKHGNLSGRLVYAMRVTTKLTMRKYDEYCHAHLPKKMPDQTSSNWRMWLGDSIYDYATRPPRLRPGVHVENQRRRDLSGDNVLLSEDFLYLGDRTIELPLHLQALAPPQQGHRSRLNDPLVEPFEEWVRGLRLKWNVPLGDPQVMPPSARPASSRRRAPICSATRGCP